MPTTRACCAAAPSSRRCARTAASRSGSMRISAALRRPPSACGSSRRRRMRSPRRSPPPSSLPPRPAGRVGPALPDATVRLLWTAGREGGGPPAGLVLVSTLPPGHEELRERGLRLAVVEWAAGALAGAKSTSYAENIAAQNQAADRGADDALLVAPDGTVLEAPTSNVWFREGDRLLTPSLSLPILAGVTRATVRELAPQAGYAVEEGSFGLARLLGADEVFLTSSVREVMPVRSIDGAEIARGPAAATLQAALRA